MSPFNCMDHNNIFNDSSSHKGEIIFDDTSSFNSTANRKFMFGNNSGSGQGGGFGLGRNK